MQVQAAPTTLLLPQTLLSTPTPSSKTRTAAIPPTTITNTTAASSTTVPTTPLSNMGTKTFPKAISPENDPNPSWTFFPPSATYVPPKSTTSPTLSPTLTPSFSRASPQSHRSPSFGPLPVQNGLQSNSFGPGLGHNNKNSIPTSTPSTHHRILDHCFHLSIETRLQQAEAQYLASTQEQAVEQQIKPDMSALKQDDWRRRQRSLVDEAVVLGRKGSNVEAIVDGILKSHRSSGPLQNLPRHLKHRLHLCQLTSMVFGRFDVTSSTNSTAGLNIYTSFQCRRRHGASGTAAIQHHFSNQSSADNTGDSNKAHCFFAQPVPSSGYCRRHHRKDCQRTCCTLAKYQQEQQQALEQKKKKLASQQHHTAYYVSMGGSTNTLDQKQTQQQSIPKKRVSGLVDAIAAFLKCSAISYRDIANGMIEKGKQQDIKETRVLEGWYQLLLEMMTQAVIETYLCDGETGVDMILDVFSYGDDDAEVVNGASTSATKDLSMEESMSIRQGNNGAEQPTSSTDANVLDRPDDILFNKTPEFEAFMETKKDRLQEFLTLNGKTMEQHFSHLAAKYPLIVFERQMTHYITRSQKLLADPKLSRKTEEIGFTILPPATSTYADGSLSMPVSDDEDEEIGHFSRLEEIKEEEESPSSALDRSPASPTNASTNPQRERDERMKLTSIISLDEDRMRSVSTPAHGSPYRAKEYMPSPPPSVAVSRSSTVSPLTSTSSYSEEDDSNSIAEAARILISSTNSSNGSPVHMQAPALSPPPPHRHAYQQQPSPPSHYSPYPYNSYPQNPYPQQHNAGVVADMKMRDQGRKHKYGDEEPSAYTNHGRVHGVTSYDNDNDEHDRLRRSSTSPRLSRSTRDEDESIARVIKKVRV
ncbi:hypothetical protein BGW38_001421 [Lunasporangiospora selenospora]|uniref:Uncharacterized protein n=1 Tax=Lunasporangiospora selenospora TaxID=979761 RepID=A0A9P6FTT5_9FUNG|nr:hypothetical protein BGW38_001421 [Lunasporangiospora selenospora]